MKKEKKIILHDPVIISPKVKRNRKKKTEPIVQEKNIEPIVQEKNIEPIVQEKNIEPIVQEKNIEPIVQEKNIEPIVQEKNIEPIVHVNPMICLNNTSIKRGRKPKGGKIIKNILHNQEISPVIPNIILHLKCFLKDIQCDETSVLKTYSFFTNKTELLSGFELQKTENNKYIKNNEKNTNNNSVQTKELWKKLKDLEYNLNLNLVSDKKSACFWCSYDFNNPPIYIPKYYVKETYQVYGCFCCPECAAAYLMNENTDSSSKFERYYLLNYIYSKIYDYKKNIKPAPNPYYLLDKYYGNLNIHEYRELLKTDNLYLIIDKPLTHILPELHEDNNEFIISNKIIKSNNVQIKKKLPLFLNP
jgi:hypothetical protein